MSTLNILHVVHQFFPHHRHGVELSTLELARYQSKQGHRVSILAGEVGRFHTELDFKQQQVDGLPVLRVWFNPRSENAYLHHRGFEEAITRHLLRLMPDVVHVQHLNHLSLDVIHAARKLDIPVVYTLRDFASFCARVNLVRGDGSLCEQSDLVQDCQSCLAQRTTLSLEELIPAGVVAVRRNLGQLRSWKLITDRLLSLNSPAKPPIRYDTPADFVRRNEFVVDAFEQVNAITAISQDVADRTRAFLTDDIEIEAIHQAPDVNRLAHHERLPGGSPLRIGYIGKFTRIKGVEVLIHAFRHLPVGAAELHLKGSPTWTDLNEIAFYRRMRKLGDRPDIHFDTIPTPSQRIHEFYNRVDLLVVPSIWFEAFGRIVIEAQASGVPVLCSDRGGVSELVEDGVDGLHFRMGDSEDLAAILQRLVKQPELVNRMSRNCSAGKSLDEYVGEIERVYRRVMEQDSTGLNSGERA
ncbi:glycosyltransferase family 4 protein [bacterium]|nr:glycosyltransferase family 4 protein [bacterium]